MSWCWGVFFLIEASMYLEKKYYISPEGCHIHKNVVGFSSVHPKRVFSVTERRTIMNAGFSRVVGFFKAAGFSRR